MAVSRLQLQNAFYDIITESKREMFDRLAKMRTNYLTVAVENIYQEHNASAVMRTCDCFGLQKLHIIEKTNKFTLQRDIAMGAGRWVHHQHYHDSVDASKKCIQALSNQGYKIVATTPHIKSKSIFELELDQPIALLFGTERAGLSNTAIEAADEHVYIPMYGFTESFNISVSAALCLQVLRNRLENQNEIEWLLSTEEQIEQKIHWCKKILKNADLLEKELIHRLSIGIL